MNYFYNKMRLFLLCLPALFLSLIFTSESYAQTEYTDCPEDESVCFVAWEDGDFTPIKNALRNTIANDTLRPDDRVYVLERGGFYWNTDRILVSGFHLRMRGETADEADPTRSFVCGEGQDEDCGPAVIQRVAYDNGDAPDAVMLETTGENSDVTLHNLWLMGQDDTGNRTAYEQIALNAPGASYTFDNIIFDKNDWHFLGPNAANVDMFVRNSSFRNIHGPTQIYEGLGVRFEVGADTVVFENNTFLNIGFTPFQSEAAPMNYFLANHNTFVNIGRSFQAGAIWKEAYVTNNVFINPFWHGETPDQYNDPNRIEEGIEYAGFFGIDDLPSDFGLNDDRRIVLSNNSWWRDPAFAEAYPTDIRMQPLYNDTTAYFFENFQGIVAGEVFEANGSTPYPNVTTYPSSIIPTMIEFIDDLRNNITPAPLYTYDPSRPDDNFSINWPLPEDFSYDDTDLLSAGTDDLPIGNLNYFPSDLETYETNRESFIDNVEQLAGPRVSFVVSGTVEGENATLGDNASITGFEGFSYYIMDNGTMEWAFNIDEAGAYDLNIWTHMRGQGVRGQRVIIINDDNPDGLSLKDCLNYGEYIWDADGGQGDGCNPHVGMATDQWAWTLIENSALHESSLDGLVLPVGENRLRIESSWGFQDFAGFDVQKASDGTVVSELRAPDAVSTSGVLEGCGMEGEEPEFCPSGFKLVELGSAGGDVTFNFNDVSAGTYVLRVFYQTFDGTQSADLALNGTNVVSGMTLLGDDAGGNFDTVSETFTVDTEGTATVNLSSTGAVNIDYVQLLQRFEGTSTSNERNTLPEGFELSQNYPNPFNPTTKINYSIPQATNVQLTVFNILGQKVATLVDGRQLGGSHTVNFDARNLASGVYFYRLKAGEVIQQRKMTLIK